MERLKVVIILKAPSYVSKDLDSDGIAPSS